MPPKLRPTGLGSGQNQETSVAEVRTRARPAAQAASWPALDFGSSVIALPRASTDRSRVTLRCWQMLPNKHAATQSPICLKHDVGATVRTWQDPTPVSCRTPGYEAAIAACLRRTLTWPYAA